MSDIDPIISEYMRQKGTRGGMVRSEKKTRSGRKNVEKARLARAAKRGNPLLVKPPFAENRFDGVWEGLINTKDLRIQQAGRKRS
jgi:hypothetical protein